MFQVNKNKIITYGMTFFKQFAIKEMNALTGSSTFFKEEHSK
jgi:hypothetical protein